MHSKAKVYTHVQIHTHSIRSKKSSLIHETRQVLVRHSPYPLVNMVEVHQEKLCMPLQLLLILLGLCLESQKRKVQRVPSMCPWHTRVGTDRLTLSAIMFRKASNTLSATAITHCIIPETRRGSKGQEHQQKRTNPSYPQIFCLDDFRLNQRDAEKAQSSHIPFT